MCKNAHRTGIAYRAIGQGWHCRKLAELDLKDTAQEKEWALHYDVGLLAQGNGLGDHVHSSNHNGDFD